MPLVCAAPPLPPVGSRSCGGREVLGSERSSGLPPHVPRHPNPRRGTQTLNSVQILDQGSGPSIGLKPSTPEAAGGNAKHALRRGSGGVESIGSAEQEAAGDEQGEQGGRNRPGLGERSSEEVSTHEAPHVGTGLLLRRSGGWFDVTQVVAAPSLEAWDALRRLWRRVFPRGALGSQLEPCQVLESGMKNSGF